MVVIISRKTVKESTVIQQSLTRSTHLGKVTIPGQPFYSNRMLKKWAALSELGIVSVDKAAPEYLENTVSGKALKRGKAWRMRISLEDAKDAKHAATSSRRGLRRQ